MDFHDDWPPDPSLQPPTHPSFRVGDKSKNRKSEAARVCSPDDDDSDSSLEHSSEMGQSSGTCGRGTALRDSASQQPESSKEWMFVGNVSVHNPSGADWDIENDPVPDEVHKGFPKVSEDLKASFSENAPAEIVFVAIFSDVEKVSPFQF